jgi:Kef-type K+ transport system membrane component KefB/mannitol/fructose-specific phosphotransferase system IIA component (Ntr-type)
LTPALLAFVSADHGAHDVARLLLALGVLLLAARGLGELARYFGHPTVLGELSAGILLGPALFGRVAPEWSAWLFPSTGPSAVVLDGLRSLAVTLFLLVAGLEVDLSRVARCGKTAILVGLFGIVVPFGVGWVAATAAPELVGYETGPGHGKGVFALFIATALSISALPVIAKTLMDLRLYKTDFGMIVIASAMFNDLAGWIVFAVILGMIQSTDVAPNVWMIALSAVGFAALMLTLGRWLVHRTLPWVQAHTAWPGGVIVFSISVALVSAALTDAIGIHAVFGAFLAGIALGDSAHLRERTRSTVAEFVSSFFAPLFFALVGLRIDFVSNFDFVVVAVVLVIACIGKVVGCSVGARLSGMPAREALAVGVAMNARGSMEIILGMTAYQHGLIGEKLLVALVIMALATSIISGPATQRLLGRPKPTRFARAMSGKRFVQSLAARDETAAVRELSAAVASSSKLQAARVEAAVRERRQAAATVAVDGLAVASGRIEGIEWPLLALGLSQPGVVCAGGRRASLVFLALTPSHKPELEAEVLRDLETNLGDATLRQKILGVQSYTELLALLRAESAAR